VALKSVGQLLPALGPAAGKHLASVSCTHAFTEAMLFRPVNLFRLICSKQIYPSLKKITQIKNKG